MSRGTLRHVLDRTEVLVRVAGETLPDVGVADETLLGGNREGDGQLRVIIDGRWRA